MNIKHSKQVISPLSTPFILAHLQKLPGVAGERAEKSGSGFGVFTCQGWQELVLVLSFWEGSALYTSVLLIWNAWLNRKSKSRYWPRHFFGLYGNNAHCLPTKAAERKQKEALRGQTQQQSVPETHSELQPRLGATKVKPNNGRWHPVKAEKSFLPSLWPQISSPLLHCKRCWTFYISTSWF